MVWQTSSAVVASDCPLWCNLRMVDLTSPPTWSTSSLPCLGTPKQWTTGTDNMHCNEVKFATVKRDIGRILLKM